MNIDFFKRLFLFVALVLAQVLVLNHIHLFGCAIPLLYVYFILRMNRFSQKWATLLWGFALGLSIDTFSNTPGLAAASLTLVALIQPYILNMFVSHDNQDDIMPTIKNIGSGKYLTYSSICIFVFCLTFFSLESFNFFNWLQWLSNIVGSTVITLVLTLVIENVRRD